MEHLIYIQNGEAVSLASFTLIDHPMHLMAKVCFEDGYENIFFTDVETGDWIEQDLGFTSLAKQTGQSLAEYFNYQCDEYKPLQWFNSGGSNYVFGYHKYMSGEFTVFEIYHQNLRYMFSAIQCKDGLWQVIMFNGDLSWNFPPCYKDEIPYLVDVYNL